MEQPFWSEILRTQGSLPNIIGNPSILIQKSQYDALIDKGYELGLFIRTISNPNQFATSLMHNLVYKVLVSDGRRLGDECRLSDLINHKITGLSIDK